MVHVPYCSKPLRMKALPVIALAMLSVGTFQNAVAESPREVRINEERFRKLDPAQQERVLFIVHRTEEIAAMDRTTLTKAERKELREEIRALRNEAQAINAAAGGTVIYISTGLIIIILLLIILL
jgi:hypothetical protein